MRTVIPYSTLNEGSWTEDLTPSPEFRQKYMYVQCMGHYYANSRYNIIRRSGLHSYLLLYTADGEGVVEYQGRTVSLQQHSSVILNCEEPHSYYTAPGKNWELYWIHFSGNCIDGYLEDIDANWDVNTKDIPGDFFHRIYDLCRGELRLQDAIECSTALIDLCSSFLLALRQNRRGTSEGYSPAVRNALAYMEEHIRNPFSLDDLCKEIKVSKYYLAHCFKAETGVSPNEYLITLRLSAAKSLLRSSSFSIAVIAERCGFSGSSYFIEAFKKREGMTPLSYRKYFLQLGAT